MSSDDTSGMTKPPKMTGARGLIQNEHVTPKILSSVVSVCLLRWGEIREAFVQKDKLVKLPASRLPSTRDSRRANSMVLRGFFFSTQNEIPISSEGCTQCYDRCEKHDGHFWRHAAATSLDKYTAAVALSFDNG